MELRMIAVEPLKTRGLFHFLYFEHLWTIAVYEDEGAL